jgi:hypothetical protein
VIAHTNSHGLHPWLQAAVDRYNALLNILLPRLIGIRKLGWRFSITCAVLVCVPATASAAGTAAARSEAADRSQEGDWHISDDTDNNTGERKVYAFQMYFPKRDLEYVTLTMRCSNNRPTFFVSWTQVPFPDQTVLTISPATESTTEPTDERYVFEKSEDPVEDGLRASPETSLKIVSAIGQAELVTVTAHLAGSPRTVPVEVRGTQRAWSRVSRHCPIKKMALPPL